MGTATQNVSIRISVIEGDKARRELTLTGEQAERALAKIKEATKPASHELLLLSAVSEELQYKFHDLSGEAGSAGAVLAKLGPWGLAAAAALGAVTLVTIESLKEFRAAEEAVNALNAALKTTDFTSGVTAREIAELGEAIQKNTLFRKVDVERAAASLTSFGDVAGEVFTRALRLSADLAVRLGVDLPTAADQLGKALEKPEDGLGRLTRKFSDLSPAQKEVIDQFVRQGDIASAQGVILDHLEGKVKGLAESQAKGLTGATNSLHDAWEDLLESFGRTVGESETAQGGISLLTKAVRSLQEVLDDSPQGRKKRLEQEIAELEDSFGTRVDRFVLGTAPVLDQKKKELQTINNALAAEQKKADEEKQRALDAADKAAAEHRNGALLEIEKDFQKKYREATQTERDRILAETADAKARVQALFKDGRNSGSAGSALEAIEANANARLAKLDEEAAKHAGDLHKKAVDDINRELLRLKPSYDTAKQALDEWKANIIENLGGATEANQQYIDAVEELYTVKLKNIYDRSLEDSRRWEDGVARGLSRYADDATNAAKNADEVFGNAARKVEDALVDMVSTGEFSFKKLGALVLDIEKDFTRSFIRSNITGPLAGELSGLFSGASGAAAGAGGGSIFSSLFAGIFHEGGKVGDPTRRRAVSPHLFITAPRLHSGLMPDEFPAILQRGETVLPKKSKAGGTNVTFNITTQDAKSFMDSRGQIMAKFATEMQRQSTRNR